MTLPPVVWTIDIRQVRPMISCSPHQNLTLQSKCYSRRQYSSDRAAFFQSSIVQFWQNCTNCSLSFLSLAEKIGMLCNRSASRFNMSWVQRWSSSVVTSVCSSVRCHFIILNWCDHSFLTSGINKAFLPRELTLTEYFLFFRPLSAT